MADSTSSDNKKRSHDGRGAQNSKRNKKSKSNYLAKAHSSNSSNQKSNSNSGSTPSEPPVQTGFRPGISGIFITCERKKEARCVTEMNGILDRYATKMYGLSEDGDVEKDEDDDDDDGDLEKMLDKGLNQLAKAKKNKHDRPFYSIKIDCQCLAFFATKPPLNPTDIVTAICTDAAKPDSDLNFRFAQRLTPITLTGKATVDGLEELAKQVLPSVFHVEGGTPLKFAIQATVRNSNNLTRDEIFRTVAGAVGRDHGHKVELKEFDVLILVVVYKNIAGISVVREFNRLAKFNVAQLQEERRKPVGEAKKKGEEVLVTVEEGVAEKPVEVEEVVEEKKEEAAAEVQVQKTEVEVEAEVRVGEVSTEDSA